MNLSIFKRFTTYSIMWRYPIRHLFILSLLLGKVMMTYGSENDSLKMALRNCDDKRQKIEILHELSTNYNQTYPDSAMTYSVQAYNLSKELGNDTLIAHNLNQIGNIYNNIGRSDLALKFFLEALEFAEGVGDKNKVARIKNNIGIVYYYQENFDLTLTYFKDAVNTLIEMGDTTGAIYGMNNIAGVYNQMGDQEMALEYFKKGYELSVLSNSTSTQAILLTGIGTVHSAMGEKELGLRELRLALELKRKTNNTASIIHSLNAIGELYNQLDKPDSALIYLKEMEKLAIDGGFIHLEKDAYLRLAKSYEMKGYLGTSLEYLYSHMQLKDSLRNEESKQTIAEMQTKYDKVQDQREIELLRKNEVIRQNELKRKEAWNYLLIGGGVIGVFITFFIYSRLRHSRKQNQIITEQKQMVDAQHAEILASINYAKRIQQAMLKAEDHESENLPEHFVLFRPKDIVSGDFYWAIEQGDYFYLAVVDCTGHGVPGAFLTVLGTAFLNEIASRDRLISPAAILEELRERIITELSQSGEQDGNKDGMDISLVRIHLKTLSAEWAGANNPLWIIKNGSADLTEYKPDKQPIGYSMQMNPFVNHQFQLEKGDLIYLFSDGYADQFGGSDRTGRSKGKKFKTRQLRELLLEGRKLAMPDQLDLLLARFEAWKGDLEQIDDVCVIGVRL